jgi:hypothetical protein
VSLVMTSTSPLGTLGSVASLLAETFDKGNRDRNHKSLENVSTERHILSMQVLLEIICIYVGYSFYMKHI